MIPDIPDNLNESPKVQAALTDFIVEAVDEATDLLATGDMSTRLALIKIVLSGAMKAKDNGGAAEAEKVLADTRAAISGIL